MGNDKKIELVRVDPLIEPCVRMRIEVSEVLILEIRKTLLGRIKYGKISLKDIYVFLVKKGLEVFEKDSNLVESYLSSFTEDENGSNMFIPLEVSKKLDNIKSKMGLNKKETFLVLLKAGLVRFENEQAHALQPA